MSRTILAAVLALGLSAMAQASVTRITIERTQPAPPAEGAPDYEIVSGTYDGELDPASPRNRLITDIARAPRNAGGKVEYRATFRIARPVNPAKSSGLLFYTVPNRGLGTVSADSDGHVRVISGWQGDIAVPGLQTITVPAARGPGGRAGGR